MDVRRIALGLVVLPLLAQSPAKLPDLYHDETYGDPPHLSQPGWRLLLNGTDLSGWHEEGPLPKGWVATRSVNWRRIFRPTSLLLSPEPGDRIAPGRDGAKANLVSDEKFGDFELYLEFMLARASNSGVYLHGQYEVQIFDSYGHQGPLMPGDCGGIYEGQGGQPGYPPSRNAARPPGQWQSLRVWFQGPRFDSAGKKTTPARVLRILLNGEQVQENVAIPGPTGGALKFPEATRNPLMLQGDHSAVAFRTIAVRPLE